MRLNRIGDQQTAPLQQPHDAPAEDIEQTGQFLAGGRSGAMEGGPVAAACCRPNPGGQKRRTGTAQIRADVLHPR
jgi:hypothetical protein